jgi:hypothetical protein
MGCLMSQRRVHGDGLTATRQPCLGSDDHDVASIIEQPSTVAALPPPDRTTGLHVLNQGQENQEDTASQDSYSVLSEDSNPPRVLRHTPLLTPADEERFFEKLYDVVKRGFAIWKEKYEGKVLKFEDYDECVVSFEEFYDEWVTFGRRDDESGFWTRHVRLGVGHEIYKLNTGWEIILGVSMGGIRDFDC